MAYVDDLALGQIDSNDQVPLNYCDPTGYYIGNYFEGTDYKVGLYSLKGKYIPKFELPSQYPPQKILQSADTLIKNNYGSYLVPTEVGNHTYIGISHKMNNAEISNMMIAFDDKGILNLTDEKVYKSIRKNHAYLKGTSLYKNGLIDYEAANKVIGIYDEQDNFYVFSLVNGAKPELVSRLFKLDLSVAYNVVTDCVKVPVNKNQMTSLISLAFDIGKNKFITSKLVKSLNSGNYNSATYFMEFVEAPLENGVGVNTVLYNRRLAEIELFTTV